MDELQSRIERLQRQARTDPAAVPIEPLECALEAETESVRERALTVAYTVSLTRPDRVSPLVSRLASFLESDRSTIRTKASLTLGNVAETEPEAVSPYADTLAERLGDRSASTTRSAIGALRRVADDDSTAVIDAIPRVASLSSARSEETRRDAVAVLESVSADHPADVVGSVDALVEVLSTPHRTPTDITYDPNATNDRSSASEQMEAYQNLVTDRSGRTANVRAREAAARTLATVVAAEPTLAADALESHYPRLFHLLGDRNPIVRASIAGTLAHLAEVTPADVQPAEEALVDLLDEHVTVAGNAVWALRFIGTETAVSALTELLERDEDDVDPAVARTAEDAIDSLADERRNDEEASDSRR